MTQYRLIALDLDGTTVTEGQAPTAGVRRAVAGAEARGARVILATGRPYESAVTYAASLGLHNPIICYQGALVKETVADCATLFTEPMPRAPLLDLLALAEDWDLDLNLYSERALYYPRMRRSREFYDLWFGLPLQHVPNLAAGLDIIDREGLAPLKCLVIAEPGENDRVTPRLQAHFEDRLAVYRSHPLFVEAVSPAVSKGQALAFLAEHYGIAREETIAVGDSGNDLSMVAWAGVGVAMGNAIPEVLAAANWVAPTVEEDGVAAVIEKYVLRNGRPHPRPLS
jgi:Cof subfamily protein (haloacid dehalogenase superfamily)